MRANKFDYQISTSRTESPVLFGRAKKANLTSDEVFKILLDELNGRRYRVCGNKKIYLLKDYLIEEIKTYGEVVLGVDIIDNATGKAVQSHTIGIKLKTVDWGFQNGDRNGN